MGYLENVISGPQLRPDIITVHGPDGVGKTTFAAGAPKPIFIVPEDGAGNLDVTSMPVPKSYSEIKAQIGELTHQAHEYQTLVIDSADWVEDMISDEICKNRGWVTLKDPGWAKGTDELLNIYRGFTKSLSELRKTKQMNIILIVHSEIKEFNDPLPEGGTAKYDRFQIKLQNKISSHVKEFSENVLFLNYEIYVKKDKRDTKHSAYGDGKRVLYTERRPAFDAKNRYDLPFNIELPKEIPWNAYALAREAGRAKLEDPTVLREKIKALLESNEDQTFTNAVCTSVTNAGGDARRLFKILQRLETHQNKGEK